MGWMGSSDKPPSLSRPFPTLESTQSQFSVKVECGDSVIDRNIQSFPAEGHIAYVTRVRVESNLPHSYCTRPVVHRSCVILRSSFCCASNRRSKIARWSWSDSVLHFFCASARMNWYTVLGFGCRDDGWNLSLECRHSTLTSNFER